MVHNKPSRVNIFGAFDILMKRPDNDGELLKLLFLRSELVIVGILSANDISFNYACIEGIQCEAFHI